MKADERILIEELEELSGKSITQMDNVYSSYDAYSDNSIIELKIRNKVYDKKMIETDKMDRCLRIAKSKDKDFVYVVKDNSGIYYLNISKNEDRIKATEAVSLFCPRTSEFDNNNKVNKLSYTLDMLKLK